MKKLIFLFLVINFIFAFDLQKEINNKNYIFLKKGMYITERLIIKHPIVIVSDGAIIGRKKDSNSKFLLKINSSNVKIEGLVFDSNHNNKNKSNVIIVHGSNIEIKNCTIKNAKGKKGYGNGIVINGKNIYIDRCIVKKNSANGLFSKQLSLFKISDSQFISNGESGIYLNNFDKNLNKIIEYGYILNNIIKDNNKSGMVCGSYIKNRNLKNIKYGYNEIVRNIFIKNNFIINNGLYGVTFNCSKSFLVDNYIKFNGKKSRNAAGVLANVGNSLISGNVIEDNYGFGIDGGGAIKLVIQNNIIKNNKLNDLVIGGSKNCIVKGNVIKGNIGIRKIESTGKGEKFPYVLKNLIIYQNVLINTKFKHTQKESFYKNNLLIKRK